MVIWVMYLVIELIKIFFMVFKLVVLIMIRLVCIFFGIFWEIRVFGVLYLIV